MLIDELVKLTTIFLHIYVLTASYVHLVWFCWIYLLKYV